MFINGPDFLPNGLMFTSMLSPILYIWLLLKGRRFVLEIFFAFLFPFLFMNMIDGIIWKDFGITATMLMTVYVVAYAMGVALQEMRHLHELIRALIWINLAVALLGLLVRFTSYDLLMWQDPAVSGLSLERFRGFDSEPAHFVRLMMPLTTYAYWQFVGRRSIGNVMRALAVLVPLLMALSYGGIGVLVLALTVTHIVRGRGFRRVAWTGGIALVILLGFFILPEHSSVRERVMHIASGTDSSTNQRTAVAYLAGYKMAQHKDLWFGVGLGAGKEETGVQAGNAAGISKNRVNAVVADTLGEMGIIGLLLRFGLEIFFFVRTRPYRSTYRLTLFIWMFCMQFMASYLSDLEEYVIWIMAFSPVLDTLVATQPARAVTSARRLATIRPIPAVN